MKEKIKVLILPKIESGTLGETSLGEAGLFHKKYTERGNVYKLPTSTDRNNCLYVKDGVALTVTGAAKVNVTIALTALLCDPRFDLSDAYIVSVGCAGADCEYAVMGDIYLASATVDYDLGNRAHQSLLPEGRPTNWYHNPDYDDNSHKILPKETVDMAWNLIKDFKPATNEKARKFMAQYNPALGRDPVVEKATFISGDTYWKGIYHHNTAKYINDFYGCPDPYRITEMEEAAVCDVLDRFGMLDRYIGLRAAVNLDDFMNGATPESVWTVSFMEALEETEGEGLGNIFELAMDNLFRAGSLIIDYLLEKK